MVTVACTLTCSSCVSRDGTYHKPHHPCENPPYSNPRTEGLKAALKMTSNSSATTVEDKLLYPKSPIERLMALYLISPSCADAMLKIPTTTAV